MTTTPPSAEEQAVIARLRAIPIVSKALETLKIALPQQLVYHCAEHTDDVLAEAILFALADKRSPRELELLAIAAAYHDIGFTVALKENEAHGARIAGDAMRSTGQYLPDEIELVSQMILDTTVRTTPDGPRQLPSGELAGYLVDADVSNFGREDFFEKAERVRRETEIADERQFYLGLLGFLSAHQWYTPAARARRSAQEARNLTALKELIARLS